jgi:hypothetical protein
MKMMTGLLVHSPTRSINTAYNQHVQRSVGTICYHNITQYHYDIIIVWREIKSLTTIVKSCFVLDYLQAEFLYLASGVRIRNMARISGAVVVVALWEGWWVTHCNQGPVVTFIHPVIHLSIIGLDQIYCAFFWEWPGVKARTVHYMK